MPCVLLYVSEIQLLTTQVSDVPIRADDALQTIDYAKLVRDFLFRKMGFDPFEPTHVRPICIAPAPLVGCTCEMLDMISQVFGILICQYLFRGTGVRRRRGIRWRRAALIAQDVLMGFCRLG